MKKHHLLLLLAVAIIVGLAGAFLEISQSARWNDAKTNRTIFQNLPINDITKIRIQSAPANVTLEKKGDQWGVAERDGYPADFNKIRDLIKTLWELKAGQEMQVGPSQLGRLKLIPPGQGTETGIAIDLKGEQEKEIASLIIGKSVDRNNTTTASAAAGRFVYNPTVKERVYLVSESFYGIDPVSVGSWLDKTFITPGELEEIDQAPWSNNPGWRIVRKDPKADWQLEGLQAGENLEKAFSQSFSTFAPTFTDVRPVSVSPDESGLADPFKINLKTFDGFTYHFLLGKQGPDKTRYLQLSVSADQPSNRTPGPNENAEEKKKKDEEFDKNAASFKERLDREKRFEKWVYLVPDWNVEPMMKRRDEILSKASPLPGGTSSQESAGLPSSGAPGTPPQEPASTPSSTPNSVSSPSASPSPGGNPSPSPIGSPTPQNGG